jgi:hypothetical protein
LSIAWYIVGHALEDRDLVALDDLERLHGVEARIRGQAGADATRR